jgi:hypothetical protein
MKPIIVTYSNESYVIISVGYLSISGPNGTWSPVQNGGYYSCKSLTTGNYADLFEKDIKLFARKIRKRKTPVTNY